MMTPDNPDVDRELTALIRKSMDGDVSATDQLFELAYDELKKIARKSPRVGAEGDTLQPTALTNELWVEFRRKFPKLVEPVQRGTFFFVAGLAMRTLLRDYERKKKAKKRGGESPPISLGERDPVDHRQSNLFDLADFATLSEALDKLKQYNEQLFEVVILRFFAGRSIEEVAEFLHVGKTTVKKATMHALAWLRRELA